MSKSKGKRFIVRLMDDAQYYVNIDVMRELNSLDNRLVRMLNSKDIDEHTVREVIAGMRMLVKSKGKRVKDELIVASDIIIPTVDISIEEIRKIFKGEGIIPEALLD
jgi:hypothetical protein